MPTTAFSLLRLTSPKLLLFSYLNTMRKELEQCSSVLDIGCGAGSPVRHLNFDYSVGVEAFAPALAAAQRDHTHTEFSSATATELDAHFSLNQFDCCVALDLIEHLTKHQGMKLIADMERIARKKILLFTPNGFLHQASHEGDLQEHRSGWTAEEMRSLGFRVIGMHGWKRLRGEQHAHRIKPAGLSGILSALTHYTWTRRFPKHAAAILCVKDTRDK
jgi:cyclopropane fatty-acyl-phospholipid synthase-like methyltransferase